MMRKNMVLLIGILAAVGWIGYQLWLGTLNPNIMAAFAVVFVLGACAALTFQKAEG